MSILPIVNWQSLANSVNENPRNLVDFERYEANFLAEVTDVGGAIHQKICLQNSQDFHDKELTLIQLFASYAESLILDLDIYSSSSSQVNKDELIKLYFRFHSQCVGAYLKRRCRA